MIVAKASREFSRLASFFDEKVPAVAQDTVEIENYVDIIFTEFIKNTFIKVGL